MPSKTNAFHAELPAFRRALARWYKTHGRRHLPWRVTSDPYAIYISEIMLQQTQVKTVLERYYAPFLAAFPTLKALARAKREQVMKQWEGLGYYSRAANLHKAAKACDGTLPQTVEGLLALPGVGRNTAHAVASFAFGAKLPVMEANVKRVLSRIFALKTPDDAALWQKARLLLDSKHAFDYNQAMMDLGALVCTKRNPRCGVCPASAICEGKVAPESYPAKKEAKKVPVRQRIIAVFEDGQGRYFLSRRKTRFLGGLYGFVEEPAGADAISFMGKPYVLSKATLLGQITQSYSHFTLQARVYLFKAKATPTGHTLVTLAQMRRLPLSRADLKVVEMLAVRAA